MNETAQRHQFTTKDTKDTTDHACTGISGFVSFVSFVFGRNIEKPATPSNIQTMRRIALATTLLSFLLAAPVWADATLFIGANTTPANRAVRGGAFGAGLLIIGFEV